jgi:hypothetical protein
MIAARADAILDQFWRQEGTPTHVQALELETWCDVLEPLSQDEVRKAWAAYQREGPRSRGGRLLRPDPGAIYKLAIDARPKPPPPPPPPEPERGPRVSAERARQIMREAGMRVTDDGYVQSVAVKKGKPAGQR